MTKQKAPRPCPAPVTTGGTCRNFAVPGAATCQAHDDTDRRRRCQGQVRKGRELVRCQAWPLTELPFCDVHDPVRRGSRRLERQALTARLARLRKAWDEAHPRTKAAALEYLMQQKKLTPEDLEAALRAYGSWPFPR